MYSAIVWLLIAALPPATPDTLVVCPAGLRVALAPWESYRREQGHALAVIEPPASTAELRATIRQIASAGQLKFVLLVGDVPAVPTNYVDAQVNVRWGSEPTIATDEIYADVDGDQMPDVAVGRMPVHSPAELAAVTRKIIRYEQQADLSSWRRRIDFVAGVGGFGVVADALIEAAGRRVIESAVPANFEVRAISASPTSPLCPPPDQFTARVCQQMSAGSFAWIYMGHGLPTQLDAINTSHGPRSILSVDDIDRLRCGPESPLAVLIACYTGAYDARSDCLAERLLACEHGPVAVIAATRVTMPYGNTVFGCELLRACFDDRPATLGELWVLAQRRTLATARDDDPLRHSLDAIAQTLTPPPNDRVVAQSSDLAAERREHVLMYQLSGDPLLRLQLPHDLQLSPQVATQGDENTLSIAGNSDIAGQCTIEIVPEDTSGTAVNSVAAATTMVSAGSFQISLVLPANAVGLCRVRAFIAGERECAAGAASITLPPHAARVVSRAVSDRALK